MGRNYGKETLEHPPHSLSFERKAGHVSYLRSSFAVVKPKGIRNPVVTSLRLTQGRTLKEGLEESKLCFPAKTSGDLLVTGVGQKLSSGMRRVHSVRTVGIGQRRTVISKKQESMR